MITQTSLQTFQKEMGEVMNDPYKVSSHRLNCGIAKFLNHVDCYEAQWPPYFST